MLDPQTSPKSYRSILETFLNNKKIPCIPPLLHQDEFIIDFKGKAEMFNNFFADQCSIMRNKSELLATLSKKTSESLTSIDFSNNDILKIIRNLDPNKAHGHDVISIRMAKIYDNSICKTLKLIFQSCLESGKFPSELKKANVVPIHKKGDKQILKNYRSISLLPITGKIFERLLYDTMFEVFTKNNLISDNQSGFKPGDSCVNQLLSITHEIYQSFDDNLEVRSVCLDISTAFDKVWHKGLIYKLKQNGISGNILNTIIDFLSFRKFRVVLNGQVSQWTNIEARVPQGSILGPLLYLIYINDLFVDLWTNAKLFADDTSLFSVVRDINTSAAHLNNDLRKISNWAFQWKMSFNPDPSKQAQEVILSRKHQKISHPSVYFYKNPIESVSSQKHLGMVLDTKLNFQEHIKNMLTKLNRTIGLLRKLQNILPRESLLTIFKSFVRPHLDYGDVI